MSTLTWTGKKDTFRAALQVPFRLREPNSAVEGDIVGDSKVVQGNLYILGTILKL